MNVEDVLNDIESLVKFFRKALQNPRNSSRAGHIYMQFKKLNTIFSSVVQRQGHLALNQVTGVRVSSEPPK